MSFTRLEESFVIGIYNLLLSGFHPLHRHVSLDIYVVFHVDFMKVMSFLAINKEPNFF